MAARSIGLSRGAHDRGAKGTCVGGMEKKWPMPPPVKTISRIHQFCPGGAFDCLINLPGGSEFGGEGCFLLTETHRSIVFTDCLTGGWRPNEESFFTLIFDMEEIDSGVQATVTALHKNENDPHKHIGNSFEQAWTEKLGQIERPAKGPKPPATVLRRRNEDSTGAQNTHCASLTAPKIIRTERLGT